MGATVPAPPILRKRAPVASGQTPLVSEAKPIYIAPQQEFPSVSAMASEPAPRPNSHAATANPHTAVPRVFRARRNRYGIVE